MDGYMVGIRLGCQKMGLNTSRDSSTFKEVTITEDDGEPENSASKAKSSLKETKDKDVKTGFPHNYEAIIKDSDSKLESNISLDELYEKLHAGVYLNNKKEKYYVEKKSKKNGFMLFARSLLITWWEDDNYWMWWRFQESPRNLLRPVDSDQYRCYILIGISRLGSMHPLAIGIGQICTSSKYELRGIWRTYVSDAFVEVAELLNVCWLEVHRKFDISKLSPGTTYEVVYVIMLKNLAYGWQVPTNFRLTRPDGSKQERKENLAEKQRESWMDIVAGEFTTPAQNCHGEIEFSMYEYGGHWKKGLVVRGVLIRPKN